MAPRLPTTLTAAAMAAAASARTATTASSSTALLAATTSTTLESRPLLPRTIRRGVRLGWSTASDRNKFIHAKYNEGFADAGKTIRLPDLTTGPAAALKRVEKTCPHRTGVLAIKKGMASVHFGRDRVPCTILQLDQVQVVANKSFDKHGYWAVQVGSGTKRAQNVTAPLLGYYEAKGVAPKRHLAEFPVRSEEGLLPVGVQIQPDWFLRGQYVDVRGISKGKGFAGVMKRHGFAGQEASHGNSLNHRTPGSMGPSQGGGSRVYPGKKMPGRMGGERSTVQNLTVLKTDNELGIVVVSGCVAGPKGGIVKLQDARKRRAPGAGWRGFAVRTLMERFPDAETKLEAARQLHMELKLARRRLPQVPKSGEEAVVEEEEDGEGGEDAGAGSEGLEGLLMEQDIVTGGGSPQLTA